MNTAKIITVILALSLSLGGLQADEPVLVVTYGSRTDQMPGPGPSTNQAEGRALAVQAHPDGGWLLLVPEQNRLMHFDGEGAFVASIRPHRAETPLPASSTLVDFDVDPSGALFFLDRGAGCVWRCDETGLVQGQYGHFLHAQRLEWTDGTVAVQDLGAGTVSAFSPTGKLLWQRKGWRWTPVLTRRGEFVGKLLRAHRLLLLKAAATALPPAQRGLADGKGILPSRATLLAVHRVSEAKHRINEAYVLGRDDAGRLAVMAEEGPAGHSKVFHLLLFDDTGRLQAQRKLPVWDNWLPDRPRFMRFTRDGELVGMRWTNERWTLVRYDLTSPTKEDHE